MKTEEKSSIKVSRRFDAPAERVFDAWLDPAVARKWLFVTDDGAITRCDLDARPGGKWTITRRGPSPEPPNDVIDMEHTGEYLEIERPRRLVFTFGVPKFSAEKTTVAIGIAPVQKGSELTLTNDGVPEEWAERTEQGWRMILDQLAKVLE
ncbi:MAG TPA: SRPBCC domain-containing protein [Fimbriimonas sp.]|nr:SRPBCC domain-containing protein [Fimbriimonas sp.]